MRAYRSPAWPSILASLRTTDNQLSGATPAEAVTLANYAAAEAVKKVGVATVSRTEILDSIP